MRILLCLIMGGLAFTPASAVDIFGNVYRWDNGDSFWLIDRTATTQHIRLCGINAPKRGAKGWGKPFRLLKSLSRNRVIRCIPVGTGTPCDSHSKPASHDRIVAQCFAGETDIAAELVRQHVVCDWAKFSGGHYAELTGGTICQE